MPLLVQLLPTGFSNRHLGHHFASWLGQPSATSPKVKRPVTYAGHGIIERILQTHRYRVTDRGLRTPWFCSRTYSRILGPGFATLLPKLSPPNSTLRRF